jgi:hypothetical protein
VTRYYFPSEGFCQKIAFLSLWSALSDESSGLSFLTATKKVKVMLQLTVGQSVSMSWSQVHSGTSDQMQQLTGPLITSGHGPRRKDRSFVAVQL